MATIALSVSNPLFCSDAAFVKAACSALPHARADHARYKQSLQHALSDQCAYWLAGEDETVRRIHGSWKDVPRTSYLWQMVQDPVRLWCEDETFLPLRDEPRLLTSLELCSPAGVAASITLDDHFRNYSYGVDSPDWLRNAANREAHIKLVDMRCKGILETVEREYLKGGAMQRHFRYT